MVKRDTLYIPDNFLSNRSKDIKGMLYNHCTSWCWSSLLRVFVLCYVYTCFIDLCALSTISIIIIIITTEVASFLLYFCTINGLDVSVCSKLEVQKLVDRLRSENEALQIEVDFFSWFCC